MLRYLDWARRDAEAFATPLFPPRPMGGAGAPYRTHPPAWRYQPVLTVEHAVERIVAQADALEFAGRRWLLIEMTPPLERFLAELGPDREDLEDGGDDEEDLGI